ncbi:MAG TPA: prepilin peptidase [Blastocatellia bacterium]|nr:prepilin peptidase [Blastocatellia bacterium]
MNPQFFISFESVTGLPQIFGYVMFFIFGAMIGSFLNVVIHRVPSRKSIVFPNSACPQCGAAIKAFDNIPILSWLILGGKCRNCKGVISFRYPAVEILTAVLWVLLFWRTEFSPMLAVNIVVASAIVALMFIDAEHMILPNAITYRLLIFVFAVRAIFPVIWGEIYFTDTAYFSNGIFSGLPIFASSILAGVAGALAGGGSLWLIGAIWKTIRGIDAMGLGDVKMMLGVGALIGWKLTIIAIFIAAFSGAVIGIALILKQKDKTLQTQIPFGIFLGIGSIMAILFGESLAAWYLGQFAI